MKAEVKSLFKIISSNSVNLMIGIILAFIIPNLLNPEQYGYYSLFTLYVSYAGFLLFGYCDGFYLIYGGIPYSKLDKKTFSSYFYIMMIYLLSIMLFIFLILNISIVNGYKQFIFFLIILGVFFQNINSYYLKLFQATSRFNIYSIGNAIEKVILLIGVLLCFCTTSLTAFYIISVAIIGKIFCMIYFAFFSRDIIFIKPLFNKTIMNNALNNIKSGFFLTLSGVGTMLMTGFGSFLIEKKISVEALGYYSFTLSVSALFSQILTAIGIVLYPLLRRYKKTEKAIMVNKLDTLNLLLSGIVLICYYPCRYILELLFPKYKPGMEALLFLFPIVICEARRLMVYEVIYKVMRLEKNLVHNVLLSICFCISITLISFEINPSILTVAAATYFSLLVRNTITVISYNRILHTHEVLFGKDLLLSFGYLIMYYLFGYSVKGFIVSVTFISINFLLDYRKLFDLYKDWRMILADNKTNK